ncbi:uncharacterized protein LOC133795921 isoform X2 [Humulus lupulus]|uniref:uncharacterized protein LOC133795921 isoform X2 n=1 Tax=Humulus lupulus TaxID=3486 RepID=UPI002B4151D8|nr:uncharacterized protein LOC133795921 isoform X2 [Humulus lupulus]
MLDGLLKPKFYSKCKTNTKLIKTRLETIKKKRNAVQKFLKNDIADLLRNGLDINAYNRAEGLLVEQSLTSCYEMIEIFCGCVSSNLSLMLKQRECPEECKEAVSSLIYAAARFADLPELRDLRNMFTERYGNFIESHLSKEFVERLKPAPFTKETKLQLLHDIAGEFSIEWDSKALEQKLYTPPPPPPPSKKQPEYVSTRSNVNGYHGSNRREEEAFSRRNTHERGNKMSNIKDHHTSERSELNLKSRYVQSSSEDETFTDFSHDERKTSSSSAGSVSEDDTDGKRPFYYRLARPPYLKPKSESSLDEPTKLNSPVQQEEASTPHEDKPKPRSVRRRNLKPPPGHESSSRQESDKNPPYESNKNKRPELAMPPGRVSSLPAVPSSLAQASIGPARATSFQPDMKSSAAHVHPKLPPDYDEFAARIAALRGKQR